MDSESRLQATQYIWTGFAAAMFFLFVSTIFTAGGLGAAHVILGIFIAIATFISTGTVWSWGDPRATSHESAESIEKLKRSRIDRMIDKLSDDELIALRERLADADISESIPQYQLGDDGELMKRR